MKVTKMVAGIVSYSNVRKKYIVAIEQIGN